MNLKETFAAYGPFLIGALIGVIINLVSTMASNVVRRMRNKPEKGATIGDTIGFVIFLSLALTGMAWYMGKPMNIAANMDYVGLVVGVALHQAWLIIRSNRATA